MKPKLDLGLPCSLIGFVPKAPWAAMTLMDYLRKK